MRRDVTSPTGARGGLALAAILGIGLLVRLALSGLSTTSNMDPDAAHFLNIARCFANGQGFSNPAAWPAWIQPAALPMPETFKEPAYPWLISHLARPLGNWFRAGQWLSLLAGAALPWVTWQLAQRRGLDHATSLLAAALVAASPLALVQSVRVMVDASFALVVTSMFLLAAPRSEGGHALIDDLAAGALFGLAFLFRAQTLLLLLPLLALMIEARALKAALPRIALAIVVAVVVASPLWLRNLALFHTPMYSDVVAYGLWPYVDHLTFSHGLEHPPAVVPFVLAHVPQVLAHMVHSFAAFFVHSLPEMVIGHALWMLPVAAGVLLSLSGARRWLFAYLYLGVTLIFISAVHWDARYFTSSVPLWALFTALGTTALARPLASLALAGPVRGAHVTAAACALVLLLQVMTARRELRQFAPPEIAAAQSEAAFLDAHLAKDEAVLAVTTSYWSWFSDRPSVHLVIADEARFDAVMDRLKVRWAALPTSRLAEFAARYPGGALPRSLVFDHADPARDVTVFAVRTGGAL